jgi:hypothetical protein
MQRLFAIASAAVLIAGAPRAAGADEPVEDEDDVDATVELARDAYETHLRHRLPGKLTGVIDGAFGLYDLRGMGDALPELWRQIRDDPDLQALVANVAQQYVPRLDYAAYAGTIADSTSYAGVAVGIEADLAAPLCRYLGGAFDGHAYRDGDGNGLAYDSRITGCLPWGPFAIELGFISQRAIRVGLDAPPTTSSGRFDAQGFELRIRGFRWLQPKWEVVTIPAEVVFLDTEPRGNDGVEAAHFTIDSGLFRYIRYGAGPGGTDRVITAFPIQITGEQDSRDAELNAVVIDVGAVRLAGVRVAPDLYLDAHLAFQDGHVRPTDSPVGPDLPPPLASAITAGVDTAIRLDDPPWSASVRYRRGLVPDTEFRILVEDRAELAAHYTAGVDTAGASAFAAYARTASAPPSVDDRAADTTYGLRLDYGRALAGALYFTARAEAARSFYADAGEAVLADPDFELRATVGVAASIGSSGSSGR